MHTCYLIRHSVDDSKQHARKDAIKSTQNNTLNYFMILIYCCLLTQLVACTTTAANTREKTDINNSVKQHLTNDIINKQEIKQNSKITYDHDHAKIVDNHHTELHQAHNVANMQLATTTGRVLLNLSSKINNCSLTYDDVFEQNYHNDNEKTHSNQNALNQIVDQLKQHIKNNNTSSNKNLKTCKLIDIDDILNQNIDKLVDRITNDKNLNYGIYGSDGTKWFLKDKNLKAPLNYFQQQFLLQAATNTLREITLKMVKKLTDGQHAYNAHYGSFWVIYGNGNDLSEGLKFLQRQLTLLQNKINTPNYTVNQSDINILKTIESMQTFRNITPNTSGELLSKTILLFKSRALVNTAKQILQQINANAINKKY